MLGICLAQVLLGLQSGHMDLAMTASCSKVQLAVHVVPTKSASLAVMHVHAAGLGRL